MNEETGKLRIDDAVYETEVPESFRNKNFRGMPDPREIRAFIPGTIIEVRVSKGQIIDKEQVILVLEAMKMYNEITSRIRGTIREINVSPGDRVEKNQLMIKLE